MCLFLGKFLHVHVHVDTHDGSRREGCSNELRETLDKTLDGVRFGQSSCVVGVCWVVGRWSSGKLKTSMAWDSDKAAALLFVGFPQRGRVGAWPDEADQNKSVAKNNQQQQFRRRSDQLHCKNDNQWHKFWRKRTNDISEKQPTTLLLWNNDLRHQWCKKTND